MVEPVKVQRLKTPQPRLVDEAVVAEERAPEEVVARSTTDAASQTVKVAAVPPKKSRSVVRPILFALLPIALVAGGYEYVTGGQVMSTENAYVQADMVGVATDVSGIVTKIDVHENQKVAVGDILFRLDDQSLQLSLTRADAQISIVRDQLQALKSSYGDMQAQIRQAQSDIDFYNTELARQQQLVSSNFASRSTFDQAKHNVESSQQKLASLTQQLAGIAANLNGSLDGAVEDHPRYRDAVAARGEIARQISHTIVRAPLAGVVTKVASLQVGQYLPAATAAFSLVSTDHLWIDASPKETELTYVDPGQTVSVSADAYPGVEWTGTVDSISPASGSSFSLLPAQNTTGNWVKVVQRIPMRVRIDTPADKPPLRVGMSVNVAVNTGHARGLPEFVTNLFGRAETPRG